MKRIAAFLLAIAIVLSATPFVFAETTSEDPATTVSGINIYCETDYETFASGCEYEFEVRVSNPNQVSAVISCNLSFEGMKILTVGEGENLIDSETGEISITTSGDAYILMDVQVDDDAEGEVTANLTNIRINETPVEDYSLTIPVVEFAAEEIGGEKYAYLSDAIAAAAQGTGKVKLLRDVELTEQLEIPAGETITLDLNGKTLSGVSSEAKASAVIYNKGTLIINDSVGGGKITSSALNPDTSNSPYYANNTITNCGTLTVNGGVIENTATGYACYAIDNNSTSAAATVTITGGTVQCINGSNGDAVRQFCNSTTLKNSLTIKGGTVGSVWVQNPSDGASARNQKAAKGSTTISGGTVGSVYFEPSANFTVSISGGTINSVGYFDTGEHGTSVETVLPKVTGGTFVKDPSACVASGCTVDNSTGNYVVSKKVTVDTNSGTGSANISVPSTGTVSDAVQSSTSITGETVQTAVNSNQKTNNDLTAAVATDTNAQEVVASVDKETAATQIQQAYDDNTVTAANVTVEVRPYLDVEAKTYDEEQTHTNLTTMQGTVVAVVAKTLTLEITPKYDVVAVADDKALVVSSGTMTNVTESVSITIPVPADFVGENEHPYVKHTKDDGTVYIYAALYNPNNQTLTFENPNGFSTFEAISTTSELQVDGAPKFTVSLTLNETLDMNFYIPVADVGNNATFKAFIGGEEVDISVETVGERHRVRHSFQAHQMTQEITVQCFVDGNKVAERTMSIQEYAMIVLDTYDDVANGTGNEAEEAKLNCALSVAVLDYGSLAQIGKNELTNGLANAQLTDVHRAFMTNFDWSKFNNTSNNG